MLSKKDTLALRHKAHGLLCLLCMAINHFPSEAVVMRLHVHSI